MAEHEPQKPDSMLESLLEKIDDKVHGRDDKVHGRDDKSSSSDSDHEEIEEPPEPKVFRLFGREKPLHQVLGGGKPADVLLWRNKKLSAGAVGIATAIWALFELAHYHLLTLVCHALILVLAILFLWSNASTFIHKSPPKIPEVHIPEEPVLQLASALRFEVNRALAVLRSIASGRDLKKFLGIIAGLWVLSVIGTCCNFLTLFYIVFIILHTVPVFYEKYEDKVDPLAERALGEFNKQYSVFDAKVLSKIPRGPLAKKKD